MAGSVRFDALVVIRRPETAANRCPMNRVLYTDP
jgi:hypothetical protein